MSRGRGRLCNLALDEARQQIIRIERFCMNITGCGCKCEKPMANVRNPLLDTAATKSNDDYGKGRIFANSVNIQMSIRKQYVIFLRYSMYVNT